MRQRVNLATEIFNEDTAAAVLEFDDKSPTALDTQKFKDMFDYWFKINNLNSDSKWMQKNDLISKPFFSVDDW